MRDFVEPSAEYGEHTVKPRFGATAKGLKAGAAEKARRAAVKAAKAEEEARTDEPATGSDSSVSE